MGLTQTGTDGLKDDAVSLAKMAGGTDGQIITYDASGNPVAVGPGTDGQVLTSTGAGSPPAFEDASAGATLSGSTDNTVVTVTGSNAMQGEANLTFDGGTLQQAIDASDEGYTILADGNHRPTIVGDRDASGEHDELLHLVGKWNNTQVGAIDIQAGSDTSNKDDGHICFYTSSSSGSLNNRLKIHNGGTVEIKTGSLKIGTDGQGIDFSAQTATSASGSSATSELLDHYEEGTWTPDLRGYNHSAGAWGSWPKDAAGSVSGKYVRVGNVCHVWFQWTGLDVQSGSQYPSIMGLPFSGSGTRGHGSSGYEDFFTNSTAVTFKVSGTYMEPISDSNSNPVMNETANRSMYAGMTYLVA